MKTLEVGFTCPKCRQERSGVDAITEEGKPEPVSCAQCEQAFDEQPAACVDCGKKIEVAWETRNRCYNCHDAFNLFKAEQAENDLLKEVIQNISNSLRDLREGGL